MMYLYCSLYTSTLHTKAFAPSCPSCPAAPAAPAAPEDSLQTHSPSLGVRIASTAGFYRWRLLAAKAFCLRLRRKSMKRGGALAPCCGRVTFFFCNVTWDVRKERIYDDPKGEYGRISVEPTHVILIPGGPPWIPGRCGRCGRCFPEAWNHGLL